MLTMFAMTLAAWTIIAAAVGAGVLLVYLVLGWVDCALDRYRRRDVRRTMRAYGRLREL